MKRISTNGNLFFFLLKVFIYGRLESMFESIYCTLNPAIVFMIPGTNGLNGAHET